MNAYKLLVVDDSALSRKLLEAAFETEGYVTLAARDGQEAMDILLTEAVDLIVTDILMPNVDGYYLCYKVRHHEKLRGIPIIIYTATYTSLSEEKIAEDMGADLFIRKPAPIHVLVEAVRKLLLEPSRPREVTKNPSISMEVMHQYSSDLVNKLEQRNIALEETRRNLEHTVQERTRELQRSNEELMASNEELQAINEELSTTNDKLVDATLVIHRQAETILVTERRLHEMEMQKSQHLLVKAYEIAKIGYWTYDTEADRAEWNDQTRKIFGVSPAYQPALQSYLALVYPDDQQRVKDDALRAITKGELFNVEHRIIRKDDGSLRWVHVRADFVQNENDARLMLGVIQDVSDRKTFEEVLLEYNQRYEILSRATNDAIWDRDIEHDAEVWNHGIETIFGYADRQISTATEWWKEKIHPEDFERVTLEIGQAFAQLRTNWISQYRYRCADGTYKYVLNRAYIIYQDERPVRMIGSMQDITGQKEFERSITAIARELSELIQHANAPIFGSDRNGYINEWNRVTEELTGYSKNEMLGKNIGLCIRDDHRQEFMLLLERVFKGSPLDNLQLPMMSKDQRDLIFLLNTTPRRNSEQQIMGVLMVGQNITELIEYRVNLEAKVQERTRELNEALRKEKELVEMKSRFVSIASHEFRTPLSTIALATGFLRKHREKISSDDFVKKLATIEKQVDHMTYLLDDILMIGKSDAGKIKTKYTPVDIETFFQQTAREVEESMRTHQVQIFIQCSVKSFAADEKLLRNILINLITNAIKFSPDQKSVMLRVTNSPDFLKVEVKDKGIGITPEDQQNIFSAFHRGANVGTIQGTGLGLSIVKKAVDLLAGQIHLSSQAGDGTSFTVTLPLRV
ncbi:PAS domain S-box-containing protein [Chryseolinea serpens]|uniref:histidine kinase n=1 Tax=Chryseolinea serpens TaxID=947013 RepID=A0A1M5P4B3_9BACT|nr:PAS domain-containing protein [Chryseolinea serpens]SHG96575.1 PAS domain S-box-containing protein [Chryseolinea serpens]